MITLKIEIEGGSDKLLAWGEVELGRVSGGAASEVRNLMKRNFAGLNSRKFYVDAAQKTEVVGSGSVVSVVVNKVGVRLQWKGGVIKPTGRISEVTGRPVKSLLIPVKNGVMGEMSMKEYMGVARRPIKYIPGKAENGDKGFLAHESGKGKDKKLTVIAWLRKKATIRAHPKVLPTQDELRDAAVRGAKLVIKNLLKNGVNV